MDAEASDENAVGVDAELKVSTDSMGMSHAAIGTTRLCA